MGFLDDLGQCAAFDLHPTCAGNTGTHCPNRLNLAVLQSSIELTAEPSGPAIRFGHPPSLEVVGWMAIQGSLRLFMPVDRIVGIDPLRSSSDNVDAQHEFDLLRVLRIK